jgi:GAF domain-containing protein
VKTSDPWRRKDGSTFWVSLSGRRLQEETAGRIHHLGMARDITERRQAQERIQGLNRVYAVLSSTNALILRVSDRRELYREACRIALDRGGFRSPGSARWTGDAMRVKPVAWHGTDERFLAQIRMTIRADAPEGIGVVGRAVRDRAPVISNDIEHDPQVPAKGSMERGARSLVVLPIVVGGEVAAVFHLYSGVVGFFDEKEMKLLTELAGDIGFALDHIEKTKKLDYLAYYDSLTGLANRTLLHERLSQYVRAARQGGTASWRWCWRTSSA